MGIAKNQEDSLCILNRRQGRHAGVVEQYVNATPDIQSFGSLLVDGFAPGIQVQVQHGYIVGPQRGEPGLSLADAQRIMRENWVAGFAKYVTPKGAPFCAVNP